MAGIKINAPFELGAAVPVDTRLTLSKAEMLTVNDNVWPSKYLTVCSDDGAIYLYDKTNEMDVETGKFRILSTDLSNCLEKVSTMPAVQEGKAYCYTGTDTADYKNGQIYTAGLTTVAGAPGNGFHTFDKGDAGLVLATAEGVDTIAVGTRVLVQYDTENHYYVFDTIVEDSTDNKLYPSSKVGEAAYECQTSSVSTSYAESYNVLAWVPGIKDVYEALNGKVDRRDRDWLYAHRYPTEEENDSKYVFIAAEDYTITSDYSIKQGHTYFPKTVSVEKSQTYYAWYNGYYYLYAATNTLSDGMTVIFDGYYTTLVEQDGSFYPANHIDSFSAFYGEPLTTTMIVPEVRWVDSVESLAEEIDDLDFQVDRLPVIPTDSEISNKQLLYVGTTDYNFVNGKFYKQQSTSSETLTLYGWADSETSYYYSKSETPSVGDSFYRVVDNTAYYYGYVVSVSGSTIYVNYKDKHNYGVKALSRAQSADTSASTFVEYVATANYVGSRDILPTPSSDYLNNIVMYTGETTIVEPIYVHGHFYECKLVAGSDPAQYRWEPVDTEVDDYDHIENRPLELTRGEELYNDTVTLDAGDTTSVTLTDKTLVADKKYVVSVDGTEHEYTATLDSSDDSINIDASDIGIVISTADAATDSTMVLTNAEFSADPAIIVKEANIVNVNPDYEEFFDGLGKESALSTDVTANTTVGGFEEDDVAPEGMTFTQFATKLLHVYKEPTLAFTSTATTYLLNKDGGVVTQPFTLTATATKQDLDIVETWIEDAEGTKLATGTTTASYIVETNVYDDVSYKAFTKDAKKTVAPKTIAYEFIYGFFKGTSATVPEASADVKALTLDLTKKAKKEYAFTASNQYLTVAYPASYGNLTKIVDQNGFDNTASFDKTVVAVSMNVWDDTEGDYVATDVNYNVYTSHDKVTCTDFKYTFNF